LNFKKTNSTFLFVRKPQGGEISNGSLPVDQSVYASKCIKAAPARPNIDDMRIRLNHPMSTKNKKTEDRVELERVNKKLKIAKGNTNELFIEKIEREIAVIKRRDNTPMIADYLTDEERSGSQPGR
jgi:hypothetical protein